jgi:hypothetical protein
MVQGKEKEMDVYLSTKPRNVLREKLLDVNEISTLQMYLCTEKMLSWSLLTMAWRNLKLWMEETASSYGG